MNPKFLIKELFKKKNSVDSFVSKIIEETCEEDLIVDIGANVGNFSKKSQAPSSLAPSNLFQRAPQHASGRALPLR